MVFWMVYSKVPLIQKIWQMFLGGVRSKKYQFA